MNSQKINEELMSLKSKFIDLNNRLNTQQLMINNMIEAQSEMMKGLNELNSIVGSHHKTLKDIDQMFIGDGK